MHLRKKVSNTIFSVKRFIFFFIKNLRKEYCRPKSFRKNLSVFDSNSSTRNLYIKVLSKYLGNNVLVQRVVEQKKQYDFKQKLSPFKQITLTAHWQTKIGRTFWDKRF